GPGHAFERVLAAVGEVDPGADDEVLDGAGDEHLTRLRERADARADVDREPADVIADRLALAGVQAGAQLEPQSLQLVANRERAADRARRTVERREEAVAKRLHRPAAVTHELVATERVVALEQRAPGAVTEPSGGGSRADDVGEEDGRKHAVGL